MNIGLTLFGQMITFLLFVFFTKRYIFPPLLSALAQRQAKIAEGLAAAARGHHDLELSQAAASKKIKEAKQTAVQIIEDAQKQAVSIVEAAKERAQEEAGRLLVQGEKDVEQMMVQAKESLRSEVANLVMLGAQKILSREIDEAANQDILDKVAEEL